jgi:ABC-type Fe3+/spermidine/putrescine transport system ATPase subunit
VVVEKRPFSRLIGGFESATSGRISLNGKDITQLLMSAIRTPCFSATVFRTEMFSDL